MSIDIRVEIPDRTLLNIPKFELADSQINFLFGESGIGKTILAKSLFGLLDPEVYSIQINQMKYADYLQSEQCKTLLNNGFFVFQEPSTHLNPLRRISEQLSEGSLEYIPDNQIEVLQGLWKEDAAHILKTMTALFPRPYRPSGGEKQRLLLAMAFKKLHILTQQKKRPALFVFDEPTGNLDDAHRDLFLRQLFKKYKEQPFTILLITHDYSIVSAVRSFFPDLLPHVRYFEARTAKEGTLISDFKDSDYLHWLNTLHPAASKHVDNSNYLLQLGSTIKVFNRTLKIWRDQVSDLKVYPGQMVYLKAESGTGKTTLAKIVMGLIRANDFRMQICNYDVSVQTQSEFWKKNIWGKKAGMVFQHADEALNMSASVRNVFEGLPGLTKTDETKLLAEINEFFDQPLDSAFLDQKVSSLSGGQKQKLNLLRALLNTPDLLILDEPFNGMDLQSLKKVIHLIQHKLRKGLGILLISHNEEIINRLVPASAQYTLTTDS